MAEHVPATDSELQDGELELVAQITVASNATFLGRIGDTEVVYKPSSGERPLWDFPANDLANREVAAYLVSEAFGWSVVPRTWLRDGPMGDGMVQLWQTVDENQAAVDIVPTLQIPDDGWCTVFDGTDDEGQPVSLVHEDSTALRRMAVFDVVVNNADRKGGHVLEVADGHRFGVDHGLTFHVEHKLRTVLWGWLGEQLTPDEIEGVARVRAALDGELGRSLAELISADEIATFATRCDRLASNGRFPSPHGQMPPTPYPLF